MIRTTWLTMTAIVVAHGVAPAQGLRLVGRSDLGGAGLNGDVTVVRTTAIVAAGLMPAAGVHAHLYNPYPCPAVTIKLVDLSDPRTPLVVGTIPVAPGVAAHGVSAARVRTLTFTGDLLAVALTMCGPAAMGVDRGVAYYDVSRPAAPRLLGRYVADADIAHADSIPACGPAPLSGVRCASSQHSVSLVQRADGRVLSLSLEPGASASKYPSGDLRVVDVSDPRHPVQVGAFPPASTPIFSNNGCRPSAPDTARASRAMERARCWPSTTAASSRPRRRGAARSSGVRAAGRGRPDGRAARQGVRGERGVALHPRPHERIRYDGLRRDQRRQFRTVRARGSVVGSATDRAASAIAPQLGTVEPRDRSPVE